MPKLSIIIPTFNSASTILRCLDSIRIQTFTDYEIVIQDGGSSDLTTHLTRKFEEENPTLHIEFQQEPDQGVYDAMNKALKRANGEWFYFLGSNDELFECSVLSDVFINPCADSYSLLYGNVMMIPVDTTAWKPFVHDGQFNLKKLIHHNICHQAMFYRKSLIDEVGEYETKYPLYGDWDFNLRCWSKVPFKFLDIVVAKFYMGGISTSGRRDERFELEMAPQVMQRFNLKLDSPLINDSRFFGLNELARMQESQGSLFSNYCGAVREAKRQALRAGRAWTKLTKRA